MPDTTQRVRHIAKLPVVHSIARCLDHLRRRSDIPPHPATVRSDLRVEVLPLDTEHPAEMAVYASHRWDRRRAS